MLKLLKPRPDVLTVGNTTAHNQAGDAWQLIPTLGKSDIQQLNGGFAAGTGYDV